jgi:hypothetical protein
MKDPTSIQPAEAVSSPSFQQSATPAQEGAVVGRCERPSPAETELLDILRDAPENQRLPILLGWLQAEIKDAIGYKGADFNPSDAFIDLGLDSLLMTDLQRRLQEKLAFNLPPMQGLSYESIDSLARFLLESVLCFEQRDEIRDNS